MKSKYLKRIKKCKTNEEREKIKIPKLHFRKYDPCRKAFKVRTCNEMSKKTNNPKGKVHFIDEKTLEFRASYNYIQNNFIVSLREPITDVFDSKSNSFISYDKHTLDKRYSFQHQDICEIIFMEELGKFYIMFVCNITVYNYNIGERNKLAGIDLGIHNPVTLFDKKRQYHTGMDESALIKIQFLKRKASRLQKIMDKKNGN